MGLFDRARRALRRAAEAAARAARAALEAAEAAARAAARAAEEAARAAAEAERLARQAAAAAARGDAAGVLEAGVGGVRVATEAAEATTRAAVEATEAGVNAAREATQAAATAVSETTRFGATVLVVTVLIGVAVGIALGAGTIVVIQGIDRSFSEEGFPVHGNYCGPGHGADPQEKPVQSPVDEACRVHDLCYKESDGECECDMELLASLPDAIEEAGAEGNAEAVITGKVMIEVFSAKLHQCLIEPFD